MPGENAKGRMERLTHDRQQHNQSQAGRERTWADVVKRLLPVAQDVSEPLQKAGNTDLYVEGYRNAFCRGPVPAQLRSMFTGLVTMRR